MTNHELQPSENNPNILHAQEILKGIDTLAADVLERSGLRADARWTEINISNKTNKLGRPNSALKGIKLAHYYADGQELYEVKYQAPNTNPRQTSGQFPIKATPQRIYGSAFVSNNQELYISGFTESENGTVEQNVENLLKILEKHVGQNAEVTLSTNL